MDNANLLTNACATLEWAREEERLQEIEVTIAQARLEAIREVVTRLSGKPRARRGRPPAPKLVEDAPTTSEPDLVA
jgi:hypothetical protein